MFGVKVVTGPLLEVEEGETVSAVYNPLKRAYTLKNDGKIVSLDNNSYILEIINNGEIEKIRNFLGAPICTITNMSEIQKIDNEGRMDEVNNYGKIDYFDNHGGFVERLWNKGDIIEVNNRTAERLGFDNYGEIENILNYGFINGVKNDENATIQNIENAATLIEFENRGEVRSFSNSGIIGRLVKHKLSDDVQIYEMVKDFSPLAVTKVA